MRGLTIGVVDCKAMDVSIVSFCGFVVSVSVAMARGGRVNDLAASASDFVGEGDGVITSS